jgi:hypothetical protein
MTNNLKSGAFMTKKLDNREKARNIFVDIYTYIGSPILITLRYRAVAFISVYNSPCPSKISNMWRFFCLQHSAAQGSKQETCKFAYLSKVEQYIKVSIGI